MTTIHNFKPIKTAEQMRRWNAESATRSKFTQAEHRIKLKEIRNNEDRYKELCAWNAEGNLPAYNELEVFFDLSYHTDV